MSNEPRTWAVTVPWGDGRRVVAELPDAEPAEALRFARGQYGPEAAIRPT